MQLDQAVLVDTEPAVKPESDSIGGTVSPQLKDSTVEAAISAAEDGEQLQLLLMDILWSDPTELDAVHGVHVSH